jgi:curved DNA-binding protein CbpA
VTGTSTTLYDALNVSPDAPPDVIRAAYETLSQKHHPDRNPGDPSAATAMAILSSAYDVLGDPLARKQYDEWLGPNRAAAPQPQPHTDVNPIPRSLKYLGAYAVLALIAAAAMLYL